MPRKKSPGTRTAIERLLTGTRLTQSTIAARCDVSSTTVSAIAREIGILCWARKSERPHKQATRDREIIRLVGMGRTYDEIGKRYGISRQRVHQILREYRDSLM